MKEIPLTKGQIALVDDEDYERCRVLKWSAIQPHEGYYYASCSFRSLHSNPSTTMMSRFIMGVTDRKMVVDHINHDTLDNRKENLRVCSQRQNRQNLAMDKSSKYPGVIRFRNGWRARIRISGKLMSLGVYADEREAARAYEVKVREMGEELVCKMNRVKVPA
jgi:hypothetical protein